MTRIKYILIAITLLILMGLGIWLGREDGKREGMTTGYLKGHGEGEKYVVDHLEQYTHITKPASYAEVKQFLREDQTNQNKYTWEFDCTTFARIVKENANKKGIKCGVAVMDLGFNYAHVLNAFDTTDQDIVYFEPQTDEQKYNIKLGNRYNLKSQTYEITDLDTIW